MAQPEQPLPVKYCIAVLYHDEASLLKAKEHMIEKWGTIDFEGLARWVKPEHLKVLEMSPRLSVDEVMEGLAYLRRVWGDL